MEAFSLWRCHPRSFEDETAWATPEAMTTKYVAHSTQIRGLTAFDDVPRKVFTFRFCLIHLKNNSFSQRIL